MVNTSHGKEGGREREYRVLVELEGSDAGIGGDGLAFYGGGGLGRVAELRVGRGEEEGGA